MEPMRLTILIFLSFWSAASMAEIPATATGRPTEIPLERHAEWLAVLLNGNRAGHMNVTREVYSDRVETREVFYLKIDRGGTPIEVQSEESYIETRDGRPLGFAAMQRISGAEMAIEGSVSDGIAQVITRSAGSVQTQQFQWPEDTLMAEGSRLLMRTKGLAPGTRYPVRVFVPSSLQAVEATIAIEGRERVDLFGVEQDLVRLTETVKLGQTETPMVAWVTDELDIRKTRMTMMGLTFEAIACPEPCATAEIEPTEFFATALTTSPQKLDPDLRLGPLTYRIRTRDGAGPVYFPESDEQRVVTGSGVHELTIGPIDGTPPAAEPVDASAYLGATRWLQVDEPAIRRLARQALNGEPDAHATMRRLERFVRDYVSDKNLSVGYASALEVARDRSGDCTEHALLLAALGRAAGIPTRVATGLAYVDHWLGAEDVFVPHAWTQALIDGRWISFDAALNGFDSGHIALGFGDGEPWDFYDGVNALGNIEIVAVEARAR